MNEPDPNLELHDIQGLLRHGYPYFDAAAYCLFEIDDPDGMRYWLRLLLNSRARWIDDATLKASRLASDDCGVAIAFSQRGLNALGLSQEDLQTFVPEFQEGMIAPHRSRLLGDEGANDPDDWDWGGDDWLHGVLIVFAADRQLDASLAEIHQLPGCPRIRRRVNGFLTKTPRLGTVTEPFGFADGLSQPIIAGLTRKPAPPGIRKVRPGEFVLGYPNEFGRLPASPSLGRNSDVHPLPQNGSGRADFGRNGSYLVMRQLEQDVDSFDAFLDVAVAQHTRGENWTARERDALREWLAAKLVGRWKSGAPLVRYPDADPRAQTQAELEDENGFGYHREDRHGLRCPIGAHIRRANPRDSLADGLGISRERAQALVDQHRILRRGRVYAENDSAGLLFLCLNSNIERQFEFVQSSWVMHPEFGGLAGETDPLLGNAGAEHNFTVQRTVLGERFDGLAQFVTVKGGAYFFLPGLRALRYLTSL